MTLVTAFQLMGSPTMSQPKCDFLKIAKDYIVKEYPFIDFVHRHPVTSESNHIRQVRYELPPDWLGFVPVVSIDTRTCTVVDAVVEQ
jgi:hypothetical protein